MRTSRRSFVKAILGSLFAFLGTRANLITSPKSANAESPWQCWWSENWIDLCNKMKCLICYNTETCEISSNCFVTNYC